MRTLHIGLRVRDVDRSFAFYAAVGYEVVGDVAETPLGHLTMLKLPGDEFVSLELVHDPGRPPTDVDTNLSHLVIQVHELDTTIAELARHGIPVDESGSSGDPAEPLTAWIVDPDGNRIELVQWPAGHPDGLSEADWAE